MVMPSSGPLNMGGTTSPVSVAAELGLGLTSTISMNDAAVRTLAGVGGSGTSWSMSSLYGKSNRKTLSFVYSASTANASLNIATISGYVAGISDVTITVNTSVYLYSTSTGTPGLTLSGGTTGDTLTLVNNGFIMGMGGAGGTLSSRPGAPGGIALQLGYPITINNTNPVAYIGGGGGGGYAQGAGGRGGGGGAGGGAGGLAGSSGLAGGAGGGIGASGANGAPAPATAPGRGGGAGGGGGAYVPPAGRTPDFSGAGGGGGRIFPGSGGAGGTPAAGAGGSANNAGVGGVAGSQSAGGGGGWGANGGTDGFAAGSGGRAVFLNGRTVTWVSGNTTRVYGAVS